MSPARRITPQPLTVTDARSPRCADHGTIPSCAGRSSPGESIIAINECTMKLHKTILPHHHSYNRFKIPCNPTLAMEPRDARKGKEQLENAINHLKTKKKVLLLTTSNRWVGQEETPKSTRLAYKIAGELRRSGVHATLIEVPKLTIHPCEGNVSDSSGNNCGLKKAILKDKNKNPSGQHRCWASLNNADDELWRITREIFTSDCVVFFASVRWGALNSYYQKLIERLTWIENMHSTLGEENIVAGIEAGLIVIGQNWNGENAFETQRRVLQYFGFQVNPKLCWNWQYTQNAEDETNESYIKAAKEFGGIFLEEGSSPAPNSSPGTG
jgi:multimeric flavodoxin WrbA